MTDDLIKRLRGEGHLWRGDRIEAVDTIKAQAAEIARLRDALEEIAALEDDFESNAAMTSHEWQMFHVTRAALEAKP